MDYLLNDFNLNGETQPVPFNDESTLASFATNHSYSEISENGFNKLATIFNG